MDEKLEKIAPISKKYILSTQNTNHIICYTQPAGTDWPTHPTRNTKHSPNNITAITHAPNTTNSYQLLVFNTR